jgi:hypothetical protein
VGEQLAHEGAVFLRYKGPFLLDSFKSFLSFTVAMSSIALVIFSVPLTALDPPFGFAEP